VTNENDYVKLGAYHTLDLEGTSRSKSQSQRDNLRLIVYRLLLAANRNFSIHKQEGGWDSVALEVIEDATKEGRGADVGAVVLGEGKPSDPTESDRKQYRGTDSVAAG
jgi:protein pelota